MSCFFLFENILFRCFLTKVRLEQEMDGSRAVSADSVSGVDRR